MKESRKERPGTSQKRDFLLEQIMTYVDEHLQESVTLKVIAVHCGVSVSTVTQLFQKRANMTFHEYITLRRMQQAEKLIAAGVPLEQVGKQVGYRDHSTFYRAFRQHYRKSPREYRTGLAESAE